MMKPRLYQSEKNKTVGKFYELLKDARELLVEVSTGNKIELQKNGVTFSMIDPFGDGELSDVLSIQEGAIELENGTNAHVSDVTNLTDLIGLIETIDA